MARIAVVDDSPTVLFALRAALERAGHEVAELRNFVELPRLLRERKPDLVVLDLELPGLSGRQFGRFVRQFEKEHTPIVLYSSRPESEIEAVGKELDVDAWLAKSSSPDALVACVDDVLAGRRAVRARPSGRS